MRVCNVPGCGTLTDQSRCDTHRRAAEQARGSAAARGYTSARHQRFRRLVLRRDPTCVLCGAVATVADHYPTSRRDLVAAGLDADDPARGRGLCHRCHSAETAKHQPGGWHQGG